MKRTAAIDIGSQTIRLLVADVSAGGKLVPVEKRRAIMGLGRGVQETGMLRRDAIEGAADCIADFVRAARERGSSTVELAATACVRQAENRDVFLQAVQDRTGLVPRVLTGHEEALTSVAGVRSVLESTGHRLLIMDIGGGSTEFIATDGGAIRGAASLPLGVIGLTERFLTSDPPAASHAAAMASHIRSQLESSGICRAPFAGAEALIGTAGTVTTLAAMDMKLAVYDEARVNGCRLPAAAVDRLLAEMLAMTTAERSGIPGLEPGRAGVIPAGAVMVREVLGLLRFDALTVSDAGLLEGIVLQNR